jgi:predicted RNase H-like nuclease (RuvC/YqgF family)
VTDKKDNSPAAPAKEQEEATSWKQWKLPRMNLGTASSIIIALGFIFWQGMMIRSQINENSDSVEALTTAIDELSHATDLANQVSMRTDQLFNQMQDIQRNAENDAFAWADIQTNMQQINDISVDLSDLEWKVDDLVLRTAESESLEPWEFDDLKARLIALETQFFNTSFDNDEWELEDLTRRLLVLETTIYNQGDQSWEIDELSRRVNELEWSSGGDNQWQIDDLYNQLYDLGGRVEVLWSVLESRSWANELLASLGG